MYKISLLVLIIATANCGFLSKFRSFFAGNKADLAAGFIEGVFNYSGVLNYGAEPFTCLQLDDSNFVSSVETIIESVERSGAVPSTFVGLNALFGNDVKHIWEALIAQWNKHGGACGDVHTIISIFEGFFNSKVKPNLSSGAAIRNAQAVNDLLNSIKILVNEKKYVEAGEAFYAGYVLAFK